MVLSILQGPQEYSYAVSTRKPAPLPTQVGHAYCCSNRIVYSRPFLVTLPDQHSLAQSYITSVMPCENITCKTSEICYLGIQIGHFHLEHCMLATRSTEELNRVSCTRKLHMLGRKEAGLACSYLLMASVNLLLFCAASMKW